MKFYPYTKRTCAWSACTRWVELRGVCRVNYHATLRAGVRAAMGDRLSPSLRKVTS